MEINFAREVPIRRFLAAVESSVDFNMYRREHEPDALETTMEEITTAFRECLEDLGLEVM